MAMMAQVVRRALGAALRNARYSALFLLAGSEALIVEWLLRATTGRGLGLLAGAALACALVLSNIATLALLPVFARRTTSGYRLGRLWLVGSLGALITGPPLALAFAVFGPLALLHPPAGETLLIASGGAAVAVGFGSMFWGWLVGQRRVEVERLAGEIPEDLARVLLIHRPSWFAQAARLGFPLALAGHTHGGQIALPHPGQHHNVSRLISRWTRGLFRDADTGALLYVNRGLGVAGPPVRLNCTREISLLRLVAPRR